MMRLWRRRKPQWTRETARAAGRLPPGQWLASRFPVLDLGRRPKIAPAAWSLTIDGAVAEPCQIDWTTLHTFPQEERTVDIHCVTRWTRLDETWVGVAPRQILAHCQPQADARFVWLEASDDYSTNLPLDALLAPDALLAHRLNGKALSTDHGGPVRLVLPQLYFWKSIKWVKRLTLTREDTRGFWEQRGYHNDADPWREERFG